MTVFLIIMAIASMGLAIHAHYDIYSDEFHVRTFSIFSAIFLALAIALAIVNGVFL